MDHGVAALAEIVGSVARCPLDVAADARLLLGGDGTLFEHRVECHPQIRSGDRFTVSRPTVIHLTSVRESALGVTDRMKAPYSMASSP